MPAPPPILSITTRTDDPSKDYVAAVEAIDSVADARRFADLWGKLYPDAAEVARTLDDEAIDRLQAAQSSEKRGSFCGSRALEDFGDILLPRNAIEIAEIVTACQVPWGAAFLRLRELGRLQLGE